jgi:hypothetical protein
MNGFARKVAVARAGLPKTHFREVSLWNLPSRGPLGHAALLTEEGVPLHCDFVCKAPRNAHLLRRARHAPRSQGGSAAHAARAGGPKPQPLTCLWATLRKQRWRCVHEVAFTAAGGKGLSHTESGTQPTGRQSVSRNLLQPYRGEKR